MSGSGQPSALFGQVTNSASITVISASSISIRRARSLRACDTKGSSCGSTLMIRSSLAPEASPAVLGVSLLHPAMPRARVAINSVKYLISVYLQGLEQRQPRDRQECCQRGKKHQDGLALVANAECGNPEPDIDHDHQQLDPEPSGA